MLSTAEPSKHWDLRERAACSFARGIAFILSSIVFHIIPTALEITMVCGILVGRGLP